MLLYYSNSVYLYCQNKLGRILKKLQVEFPKESPVYCPMSRPRVDVATWISLYYSCSVATLLLLLQPDSLLLLGLMVLASFVVATLFAQCFSRVDVVTSVSCRDIVVFLFFRLLSGDLSFRLRPHLFFWLTSGHDFLFLVTTLLVVFYLRRFQI